VSDDGSGEAVSQPADLLALLASTAPLSGVPIDLLVQLLAECEHTFVSTGDVVVRADEVPDRAFIVVSGRLRVFSAADDGRPIAELGPGQLFGEMALLSPGGRRATVVAARDSELLCLDREQFSRVFSHPDALMALVRLLVERATTRVASSDVVPPRTITVVGVASPRGEAAFVEALIAALSREGPTTKLDVATIETMLGPGAADVDLNAAGELLAVLDRVERANRFVVYHTDPGHPAWTDRCLRHADRVLLVVDADSSHIREPAPSLHHCCPCAVVVLHDRSDRPPRATAATLDALPPGRHYHVRRGDDADVRRVARQLSGGAVGLVLGGGGARGFAHLGVVRAFETAGVPIDAVGGTSVGALMGALVAWGLDHPTRVDRAHRFVAGRLTIPTLPILAATSARRVTQRLQHPDYAGDRDIADCWLPFFCVSTNLSTARPFVHRRGPAWQALRASISLPGLMPPVCTEDGELLVDGGLVDDLPVDVMAPLLDGGRVVAVDLGISSDFRVQQRFDPNFSGWRVLARRLNPWGPRFDAPNLLTTLLRAKEVASHESLELKRSAHAVTLLVRPPVEGFGGFDFRNVDVLTERSYRYTLDLLDRDPVAAELMPPTSVGR
jgi:predicted acylesterase/phospholipase RssA/CRP-like cAMP-binding protein